MAKYKSMTDEQLVSAYEKGSNEADRKSVV